MTTKVPESMLDAQALANAYVTRDTAQTITASKDFTSEVLVPDTSKFDVSRKALSAKTAQSIGIRGGYGYGISGTFQLGEAHFGRLGYVTSGPATIQLPENVPAYNGCVFILKNLQPSTSQLSAFGSQQIYCSPPRAVRYFAVVAGCVFLCAF